jgi:hypothetical protein
MEQVLSRAKCYSIQAGSEGRCRVAVSVHTLLLLLIQQLPPHWLLREE